MMNVNVRMKKLRLQFIIYYNFNLKIVGVLLKYGVFLLDNLIKINNKKKNNNNNSLNYLNYLNLIKTNKMKIRKIYK